MLWEEQYAAMRAAKRYPGAWIHFANIPKMGVNPQKAHRDPPGIYFYPCRWLLSYDASRSQYAVHYPYYFVCRIAPSRNSIDLSRMTTNRARAIAAQNGWLDDMDRLLHSGKLQSGNIRQLDRKLLRRPGGAFYACLDYLVNVEGRHWLQLLRGVDAIFDNGAGIISAGETNQAVVIDRKLLTVLEQGENKDEWDKTHARMMQELAQELGGKFYFMHKIPTVEVQIEGKPIKMEFDSGNWRIFVEYYINGQWVRDQQRYENPSEGDYAHVKDSLERILMNAAKKASAGAGQSYWTKERIYSLFNLLMLDAGRLFKTTVWENKITYSAVWDSGFINSAIYANVVANDTLEVRTYIALSHETIAQVDVDLPAGTNVEQTAAQMLAQLNQQAHQNRPEMQWDNPRLPGMLRFRLAFG